MLAQRLMWIIWPAFLVAGLFEVLVFGLVFVVKRLGPVTNYCALKVVIQSELMLNFCAQGEQS